MKILITGSHFTPAQSVIEELFTYPDTEVVYVGRKFTREGDKTPSVESQILPKLGVKFISIISGRLQRSFSKYTIPSLLKIPLGFIHAFYIVASEHPDVILSFGGYVSVPVVISGWLFSVPVIIHQQTLVNGLANNLTAPFATKIAVTFNKSKKNDDAKYVLTGNPLRPEIVAEKTEPSVQIRRFISQSQNLPLLLVTGGNQGSHILNQTIKEVLAEITSVARVIHQTGDSKFKDDEILQEAAQDITYPQNYLVEKWIEADDFAYILRHADLVVSRAGINTLLEVAFIGVPAILIPIPYLTANEQESNASFFESLGLARVIKQKNLSAELLLTEVKEDLKILIELKNQAKKAKKVVVTHAAQKLSLEVIRLGQRQR